MTRRIVSILAALLLPLISLSAQDGFGFGFDDDAAGGTLGGGGSLAVSIGGEASASMTGFVDDFSDGADHTRLGDVFSGKLKFTVVIYSGPPLVSPQQARPQRLTPSLITTAIIKSPLTKRRCLRGLMSAPTLAPM
jgi:hypothetical protein